MTKSDQSQDSSVKERVRELRGFADTITALSDEELEKVVGGVGYGVPDPLPDWWQDSINYYINNPARGPR